MRRAIVLVVAAACGRISFTEHDAKVISLSGCSDGEREGFADVVRFPTIAGCKATWVGTPSMRAGRTGAACGDDVGMCVAPADACGAGWHVCSDGGDPTDVTLRASATDCGTAGDAVTGSFVAAAGHCTSCSDTCMNGETDCVYGSTYVCSAILMSCNEPVCCGPDCATDNQCKGGFYPAPDTHIGQTFKPCGALPDSAKSGVLCCAD